MTWHTCYLVPIGKPRMTQRDKYMKRPAVVKYRIFADALRECLKDARYKDSCVINCAVYLPMPESWSKKKKVQMTGANHRQKPDADNIIKALGDSLFEDDSVISDIFFKKRWDDGNGARIEICFG